MGNIYSYCLRYNQMAAQLNSYLQAYVAPMAKVEIGDTPYSYTVYMHIDDEWLYFAGCMNKTECADMLETLSSNLELMGYQALHTLYK